MPNVRSKAFNLLLYPDSDNHMKVLETIRKCYEYAYIYHNSDINDDGDLKKSHIHCIVKFKVQKGLDSLCNELGIENRFVQKVSSLSSSIRYLCHLDNPDKYQYDINDVVTNFDVFEFDELMNGRRTTEQKVMIIIELMNNCNTLQELIVSCVESHVYDELRRMGNLAIKLFHEMKGH